MKQYLKVFFNNRAKVIVASVLMLAILALGIPSVMGNQFILNMVIMILIFAALSSSWNIIGGMAGQLSLGHSSFFGIGAYTVVLMNIKLGVSPWIGLLCGMVLAVIASLIIGFPCFRLRGPFFTLSTVAVGEVMRYLAINLTGLTYGSVGVSVVMEFSFANMLFREKWVYFVIVMVFLGMVLFTVDRVKKSRLGYYLVAIREDQEAAASLGINATKAKIISFAISVAFTSLGGSIYAQYLLYIDPASVFSSDISRQMVVMAVVGGLGTKWGPMLGALLLVPLDQLIRAFFGGRVQGLNLIIYAAVLILVILTIPQGILPTIEKWVKKHDSKSTIMPQDSQMKKSGSEVS
jgi:branched-chain amino acid transport system permease protein